uniref:Ig-like domain-containing protein n=1 Tax=Anas platyrhynchos platyrhynchos TaxID=8840 RepID=A0A493T072_ANAPP
RLLQKPTEVTKQLEDKTAAAGQDISLSCELSKPDVSIRWYKDEGTRAILIIHDSTVKDSGEYTCETEVSKTKAKITVQGQLKHTQGLALKKVGVNISNLWEVFFCFLKQGQLLVFKKCHGLKFFLKKI